MVIFSFRAVFWVILPCRMIVDRRFRGTYCLHNQGWMIISFNIIKQLIFLMVKCFFSVWGTDWILKYCLDEFRLQRVNYLVNKSLPIDTIRSYFKIFIHHPFRPMSVSSKRPISFRLFSLRFCVQFSNHVRATCTALVLILNLTTLITFGEENK
jgi:hypothetical protein